MHDSWKWERYSWSHSQGLINKGNGCQQRGLHKKEMPFRGVQMRQRVAAVTARRVPQGDSPKLDFSVQYRRARSSNMWWLAYRSRGLEAQYCYQGIRCLEHHHNPLLEVDGNLFLGRIEQNTVILYGNFSLTTRRFPFTWEPQRWKG